MEHRLCPEIFLRSFLYSLRNKRPMIAVSSLATLADLPLDLAGFSHC